MMRIAFYIPNKGFCDRNLSDVDSGNPGIGGSEFSAILISSNLAKESTFSITLLCDENGIFPKCLQYKACGCLEQALIFADKEKFDYVVVDSKFLDKDLLVHFYGIKFIAWANCFIEPNQYKLFAESSNLVKIVNVGFHQHELLRKTVIGDKSTYIFNAVPSSFLSKISIIPIKKRKHNVVYIGSLHRAKGFHVLAKAWPKVLKEEPDAHLYVIGSGRLYGSKIRLGDWKIAQKDYEEEFMPYLTTENGKILPSVHFLGIMGEEKYDLLNECKVGVPNPSGVSETFGYTAVEMELMGCHVTTIKCPGYLDTVCEQQNLYENSNELAANIVSLLRKDTFDYAQVLSFASKFSIDNIIGKWITFFSLLKATDVNKPLYVKRIKAYVKIKLRIIKCNIKSLLGR